jgi:hypothetical protein
MINMEDFIKEYINDITEENDIKLTAKQFEQIYHNILDNDYIWDVLDEIIREEISDCISD